VREFREELEGLLKGSKESKPAKAKTGAKP
jgi:hypothetical protein